jgi:hypothetical protein
MVEVIYVDTCRNEYEELAISLWVGWEGWFASERTPLGPY